MARERRGYLGIDVGSKLIKVAQIVRLSNNWAVDQFSTYPRTTKIGDELIDNLPSVLRGIQGASDRFHGDETAMLIPFDQVRMRTLSIDLMKDPRVHRVLMSEFATQEKININDYEINCWQTKQIEKQDGRESWGDFEVLAIPKRAIETSLQVQRNCRLNCQSMISLPHTLARAVQLIDENTEEPVAILDFGFNSCTFCVVQNGQPVYVRRIRTISFSKLVAELQKGLPVQEEEIMMILQALRGQESVFGIASPDIIETCYQNAPVSLNQITAELNRTLRYLSFHHKEFVPSKCYLCGAGATFPNLSNWLHVELNLPFESWRLPTLREITESNRSLALLANACSLSSLYWNLT